LHGRLDVTALGSALGEIVRRHEVLRTTFHMQDGEPVQVISEKVRLDLLHRDLSGIADERQREQELRACIAEESQRPFDLGEGPLLRAHLLRLGEEEHALLLNMHHVVSDGWSMGVIARELSALYNAYSQGQE